MILEGFSKGSARAQDAYCTLCSLYGEHNAQSLMKVRGACNPWVWRLARKIGTSKEAIKAAEEYRKLHYLRGGWMKLMTACNHDGKVKRIINAAGYGRKFTAWEVDTAVSVVLAVIDAKGV